MRVMFYSYSEWKIIHALLLIKMYLEEIVVNQTLRFLVIKIDKYRGSA